MLTTPIRSMKLHIENFATLDGLHKILMLGAMAEMGADTAKEHEALIALIKIQLGSGNPGGKTFSTLCGRFYLLLMIQQQPRNGRNNKTSKMPAF